MDFLNGLTRVLQIGQDMKLGGMIGELIVSDRDRAAHILQEVVKGFSPQQLDEFEAKYFIATTGMITPALRIRAMELYAYLKVLETAHYGQWRGFSASTKSGDLN